MKKFLVGIIFVILLSVSFCFGYLYKNGIFLSSGQNSKDTKPTFSFDAPEGWEKVDAEYLGEKGASLKRKGINSPSGDTDVGSPLSVFLVKKPFKETYFSGYNLQLLEMINVDGRDAQLYKITGDEFFEGSRVLILPLGEYTMYIDANDEKLLDEVLRSLKIN